MLKLESHPHSGGFLAKALIKRVWTQIASRLSLVRQTGLEPVRQRHTPLKRACLPIPAPVSYTHLDVYKRQAFLSVLFHMNLASEFFNRNLLCALEVLDEDGRLERKADMFTKRTIKPHEAVASVDTCLLYTSRCV